MKKDPVPIEKGKPAAAKEAEKPSTGSKKVESKKPVKEEKEATAKPSMSVAQKKAIINLAKRRGISEEDLQAMAVDTFDKSFEFLSPADASKFIRQLQQSA